MVNVMVAAGGAVLATGMVWAQVTGAPANQVAPKASPQQQPLRLQSLDPATRADPFPPVNPKYFTAQTPTVATVDGYLKTVLGYDPDRIWRVEAIEKTAAPGVSRVVVYVSSRAQANAKVQTAIFFVLPDARHAVAEGSGVTVFGEHPFADNRAIAAERAHGPFHGPAARDLEMVEFVDLQSPNSKAAEPVMRRLAEDFPKAHIAVQPLPVMDVHPLAYKAAAYGVCVAKASNQAYFDYQQAVFDTQAGLTVEAVGETLKAAAIKASQDPAAVAACSATDATKAVVDDSVRLAGDLGIGDTPALVVNGRSLSLSAPYETLKQIILFEAGLDGVSAAAAGPAARPLLPR